MQLKNSTVWLNTVGDDDNITQETLCSDTLLMDHLIKPSSDGNESPDCIKATRGWLVQGDEICTGIIFPFSVTFLSVLFLQRFDPSDLFTINLVKWSLTKKLIYEIEINVILTKVKNNKKS